MIGFYAWNPKARNYGGSTQGLRWLFWLIPFWLVVLPTGLAGGQDRRGGAVVDDHGAGRFRVLPWVTRSGTLGA